MIDNKEYARQLRTNAAKDENGVIRCSPELWEEIARIIENSEEVKHGEWNYIGIAYECNLCGKSLVVEQGDAEMNYCPHCGTKMDGERKDEM